MVINFISNLEWLFFWLGLLIYALLWTLINFLPYDVFVILVCSLNVFLFCFL